MTADIAVIGSITTDLVTYGRRRPASGETLAADDFAIGQGGKGANQAVAAARLGSKVLMLGRVGDDAFGRANRTALDAAGVDTRHVTVTPGCSSGVASIFVDAEGENAISIVAGANGRVAPADIDAAANELARCRLILLQLEIPLDTVRHALAFGHRHAIPTILNPAPAVDRLDPALIALADIVAPNEGELALLTGLPTQTDTEIEAAARHLVESGAKVVVVTLGARGALEVGRNGSRPVAPVAVRAVDTTGAGDAFIGALAHFRIAGLDDTQALARACAYAACSVTRRGAQSAYPTRDDFERFLLSQ
ncbi:ribokinase [Aurantimonas sp. MSK8Z-1]|uniref:ribokinase n=1 Tax=Mangrovibrevibacter kandeliae TaxID=2968473 RepID=UPI0021179729|nr:ribokinase [Aurantimonas sp. MSK8Z-1]MCW4116816.1 ribokinase [Aurantimonas sp. MSK8Z-1]